MNLVKEHTGKHVPAERRTSVSAACQALGLSRAALYRQRAAEREALSPKPAPEPELPDRTEPKPRCSHQLSEEQEAFLLALLLSEAYVDLSVRQVFAEELDAGNYHASVSAMYRILRKNKAVRERRCQRRHAKRAKPSLEATRPNQVWTWDITKIPGPARGRWYCLYVVIDLFSRRVVGWCIHREENAAHAKELVATAAAAESIATGQLTLHADNGAPMISNDLAGICKTLGVSRSFSRPRVSNDNPFSEAQFKTTKYHRDYPGRFESLAEAEAYFEGFIRWYNTEHHHGGIALFTPDQVHSGTHLKVQKTREAALDAAYRRHPERFAGGRPRPKALVLPDSVSINPEPSVAVIKPAVEQTDGSGHPTSSPPATKLGEAA